MISVLPDKTPGFLYLFFSSNEQHHGPLIHRYICIEYIHIYLHTKQITRHAYNTYILFHCLSENLHHSQMTRPSTSVYYQEDEEVNRIDLTDRAKDTGKNKCISAAVSQFCLNKQQDEQNNNNNNNRFQIESNFYVMRIFSHNSNFRFFFPFFWGGMGIQFTTAVK